MMPNSFDKKINLNSIRFQDGDLTSIWQRINLEKLKFSGYFKFIFDDNQNLDNSNSNVWYVFFSKGKIVFSHGKEMSLESILEILKNYLPGLRAIDTKAKTKIDMLFRLANKKNDISVLRLLMELTINTKLVEYQDIIKAIQVHLFNDFEQYLCSNSGSIKITFDKTVDTKKPIVGFNLEQILFMVNQRKIQWQKLREVIPSMSFYVGCNEQNPQWKRLPSIQKKRIKRLVNSGKTLEEIRFNLGEDSLKIANFFAKLIDKKLVFIDSEIDNVNSSLTETEQLSLVAETGDVLSSGIAIIDDSPILLKQFKKIVTDWGYDVRCCDNDLVAVDFLLESPPEIIFLDVNMPNYSGFQLMKQIRLKPELNSIPVVILTAEKTLMNRQRAKWAKSVFLTKPLKTDEIDRFESDLKSLLEKMLSMN